MCVIDLMVEVFGVVDWIWLVYVVGEVFVVGGDKGWIVVCFVIGGG